MTQIKVSNNINIHKIIIKIKAQKINKKPIKIKIKAKNYNQSQHLKIKLKEILQTKIEKMIFYQTCWNNQLNKI